MVEVDRVEADVLADEVLELAGGDFAEAFQARDFVARAERGDGGLFFEQSRSETYPPSRANIPT